ncbi:MAG: hypothetical protein U0R49_07305 [Fimbriimonadales bacterium]
MGCNQNDFTKIIANIGATVVPWAFAQPYGEGNPWLVLSDHPEAVNDTVPPSPPYVLYRCKITIPASGQIPIRCFLWHLNDTGSDKRIWIAAQIVAPSGGVEGYWSNHNQIGGIGNAQPLGLCISKAQLFGTLDVAPDASGTIPATGPGKLVGETVKMRQHPDDEHGELYGALHEFVVSGPPEATIYLWTCLSNDDSVGTIGSTVIPSSDGHHRGSWPYANIECFSQTIYPITAFGPVWYSLGICDLPFWGFLPPDVQQFLKRPDDTYGTVANKGLFGANCDYKVVVVAPTPLYWSGYLRARNTGEQKYYQGAAVDQCNTSDPQKGVPPIKYLSAAQREGVQLACQGQIPPGQSILTFPNATGGAATLPVDLLLGFSSTYPVPDPVV